MEKWRRGEVEKVRKGEFALWRSCEKEKLRTGEMET